MNRTERVVKMKTKIRLKQKKSYLKYTQEVHREMKPRHDACRHDIFLRSLES